MNTNIQVLIQYMKSCPQKVYVIKQRAVSQRPKSNGTNSKNHTNSNHHTRATTSPTKGYYNSLYKNLQKGQERTRQQITWNHSHYYFFSKNMHAISVTKATSKNFLYYFFKFIFFKHPHNFFTLFK